MNVRGLNLDLMSKLVNIKMTGRLHSGLDDSINLARICMELNKMNIDFVKYIKQTIPI